MTQMTQSNENAILSDVTLRALLRLDEQPQRAPADSVTAASSSELVLRITSAGIVVRSFPGVGYDSARVDKTAKFRFPPARDGAH